MVCFSSSSTCTFMICVHFCTTLYVNKNFTLKKINIILQSGDTSKWAVWMWSVWQFSHESRHKTKLMVVETQQNRFERDQRRKPRGTDSGLVEAGCARRRCPG